MKSLGVLLLLVSLPLYAEEQPPPPKVEMTPAEVAKTKKVFTELADACIKNQTNLSLIHI